jgi:hypothetical protein
VTRNDISEFTRQVDSLIIDVVDARDLRRKLNVLDTNGRGGWQLLRQPMWVGSRLVAVLLRPEIESVECAADCLCKE